MSTAGLQRSRSLKELLALVVLVGVCHAPLLASKRALWDDLPVVNMLQAGKPGTLIDRFREAGLPQAGVLHVAVGLLPDPVRAYKFLALVCIIGSAICLYHLARLTPWVQSMDAVFIAALAMIYPFYSVWADPIMLPYSVALLLFLLAACIYSRHLKDFSLRSPLVWLALVLFLLSFTIESLLVFFYGLFAYFFWIEHGRASWPAVRASLRQHSVALILPPIYFAAKHFLFPVRGHFAEYNQLEPSLTNFVKCLVVAPKRIMFDQLIDAVHFVGGAPKFFLILAAICLPACIVAGLLLVRRPTRRPSARECLAMIGFAVFMFIAAMFAYCAVGKFPLINNYNCRHGLLASIPIAIAVVAVWRFMAHSNGLYCWGMLAALLLCMTLSWRSEIRWENRYAKYLAIVENLRDYQAELTPSVVIDDRSRLGMPEMTRDYEINWMLKQATGNERHLGLNSVEADANAAATLSRDLYQWDREFYMFQDVPYPETQGPLHFDEDTTRVVVSDAEPANELATAAGIAFSSDKRQRELVKSLVKLKLDKRHISEHLAPPSK